MKVKIKKLAPEVNIPSKREGDLGFDLVATSEREVTDEKGTFGYLEYGTNLAIEIPQGYGGFIFPRSSISDTGLILSNAVGVIDPKN